MESEQQCGDWLSLSAASAFLLYGSYQNSAKHLVKASHIVASSSIEFVEETLIGVFPGLRFSVELQASGLESSCWAGWSGSACCEYFAGNASSACALLVCFQQLVLAFACQPLLVSHFWVRRMSRDNSAVAGSHPPLLMLSRYINFVPQSVLKSLGSVSRLKRLF
jgi:hypothetical protein